jgi:hypothetical protein
MSPPDNSESGVRTAVKETPPKYASTMLIVMLLLGAVIGILLLTGPG